MSTARELVQLAMDFEAERATLVDFAERLELECVKGGNESWYAASHYVNVETVSIPSSAMAAFRRALPRRIEWLDEQIDSLEARVQVVES